MNRPLGAVVRAKGGAVCRGGGGVEVPELFII